MSAKPRTRFGVTRRKCGCFRCVANCECIPGLLDVTDLERMMPPEVFQDPEQREAWIRTHLRASDGAKMERRYSDGRVEPFRIPTLVPAHQADGSCHWLKNGRCEIHAVAPAGCAFFTCDQGTQEGQDLSMAIHSEILEDHQTNGPYARAWNMLRAAGLNAPSVEDKRARLAARIDELCARMRRRLGLGTR